MLDRDRVALYFGYFLIGLIIVFGTLNVFELGHCSALAGNWISFRP